MTKYSGAVILLLCLTGLAIATKPPAKVQYEWKYLNFTWPSAEDHDRAINDGSYIPENNPIAGIKVWKDRLYLTIPRWKHGVPATLLVTSLNPVNGDVSPNVEPFPNWQMQRIGDCSAFQFVQSMEIDPKGRMWVIDTGRVATLADKPENNCPARLVVLDLENNAEVLLDYVFPEEVTRRDTVYLNDIVLEHEDGGWAFITDTDDEYPGIVVFSLKDRKSWKVSHETMKATAVKFTVKHDGTKVTQPLNVDGIAISPASAEKRRILYYSPLSSLEIFAVPTSVLKRQPSRIDKNVRLLGRKPSQTDGMMVSADGRLYFGLLADNTVSSWDSRRPPFWINQKRVFEEDTTLQWPDTFAIDEQGTLWCVSNRLQTFLADSVDTSEVNYRVLKLVKLPVRSYQYYKDGSAPELPVIA
ncbi:yellow-x1c precursor [Nasonia vitripennis]|uniref:Bee-milk protein n=1 Tax=Nasonia vitripennis TaxID=7425 RepID=A0A7M6UFB4_NASVI|nr:yellow-x1c precursor [Nasonia vitripennis]